MSACHIVVLGLGMLLPADSPGDPARLREMLYDRQHARNQSQAALLLLQSPSPEAEEIVQEGLRQTDSPEVFQALAAAVRLQRDRRFIAEILITLRSGHATLSVVAAETLAEIADSEIVLRLQTIVEDSRAESLARQAALRALGLTNHKSAAVVLLDQLSSTEEAIRQSAAEALSTLTGQNLGNNLTRWRQWWERHKDLTHEKWNEERLAFHASRARRLEGELERTKAQIVRLHQQLYSRLPAADRLGHVQASVEHEDPQLRALAVTWSLEQLPTADAVGQRLLADTLLRLSRDGNIEVQRAAVLALGRVQDARAYDRLRVLIQKGRTPVRAAAARALPQQTRGVTAEALARQRQIVPILQKALDDAALEVVIEAAEGLGSLGVPEASPVLTVLLRHPSGPVRQAAAQALERIADPSVLDGLLEALDDSVVTVRFSLVGALGQAAGDGKRLTEPERAKLEARLEALLVRDADPGVRSRAATVLGQCGSPVMMASLWRRVIATEENRVQEKAWSALVDILIRSANLELLREWDRKLLEAKQGSRRLALLTEVYNGWLKKEEAKPLAAAVVEALVQSQLEQAKWSAAVPLLRELLARPGSDVELEQRLRWFLQAGEEALKEGNRPEALRVAQEAQPFLARVKTMAGDFEQLERQAKKVAEAPPVNPSKDR